MACLVLGACAGVQTPLMPAGVQAERQAALFALMLIVCVPIYALVIAALGWSVWRARRKTGDAPDLTPADAVLGRGLILWAGIILIGLSVLITGSFLVERKLAAVRRTPALAVRVTAHQWWWRIQYRDPASGAWIETANELHLPQGRTARLALGSADVIHSFWVPNLAGIMDVIPGRDNVLDVIPTKTGWFRGQCAEFCGIQHAHMAIDVKVESPADFARWMAAQTRVPTPPTDPVARRGLAVVTGGACAACHVVRGTPAAGRAGPDLTHVGSRRSIAAGVLPMSRGALQGWIAQPQALKPGTMMPTITLSGADADAAARYLEGLR
jgi:cytochrome c oxidase subunit 2